MIAPKTTKGGLKNA